MNVTLLYGSNVTLFWDPETYVSTWGASLGTFFAIVLLIAFNALVFWQKNVFLYPAGAVVDMVYGFRYAGEQVIESGPWVLGIMIGLVGVFCIYRTALDAWKELKPKARKG